MESRNKQKNSGTSYNIISYNQLNLDLLGIAQKAVADFLDLVGVHASIQTLECKGNDELVSEWEALGVWRKDDKGAFCGRLEILYNKAASRLPVSRKQRGILVTSLDVGRIVGLFCYGPTIISSHQISNHRETHRETFETTVFHELGHMHKIPSWMRTNVGEYEVSDITDAEIVSMEHRMKGKDAIFECLGEHCLNIGCSMRQRLDFQNWKDHITKERLEIGRPYCDRCLADLKGFFKNSAKG